MYVIREVAAPLRVRTRAIPKAPRSAVAAIPQLRGGAGLEFSTELVAQWLL